MTCTILLCNKKYRSPCSFKRKEPSHLFNYTSPVTGNLHFEKERTDVFALSTISIFSLSFLFLPCHKFPPLLPNHAFTKRQFFSRVSFSARKAANLFSCQLRVIMRSTGCAVQYWGITLKAIIGSDLRHPSLVSLCAVSILHVSGVWPLSNCVPAFKGTQP